MVVFLVLWSKFGPLVFYLFGRLDSVVGPNPFYDGDNIVKILNLNKSVSVTRFGDFSPFWQFSEAFGDNFFAQNRLLVKALLKIFWLLKTLVIYCGDKFGDFYQNVGDFFILTPGHTEISY